MNVRTTHLLYRPYLPPVLRLHPEIEGLIADKMDLLTLSRWRATCRDAYIHGSSSLQRTLTNRLKAFVARPHELVDIVTKHGAVFGGELALSFLLREQSFRPSYLDVYVGNSDYSDLCDAILNNPRIRSGIVKHSFITNTTFYAVRRLITESLSIHFTSGRTMFIHRSYTNSPSVPIARSTCSALSNFVTAYGFGCSHPRLTLARRALLADRELLYLSSSDTQSLNRIIAWGFSMAVSPTAWPEYRREVEGCTVVNAEECGRRQFVCPNQGRFFGDKGSLVGYFDPLGEDESDCMTAHMAPFGPMVIWRLSTTFECDDRCEYLDGVLEHGVTSIPVLFRKDPYGELRESLQERITQYPPFFRQFGRSSSPDM